MRQHTRYATIPAYTTKDQSEIRELMHPALHGNKGASLAEATVPPHARTLLHKHNRTEEIYHITQGAGRMQVGGEIFAVQAGDSICIPAAIPHCIENSGDEPMRFLCVCTPAYSHDDTEVL
jgi:mannose-6-phosphate isomerase-like protein (cupin superfamily)